MEAASTMHYRVETRTRGGTAFAIAIAAVLILALAAPLVVSRSAIQDLFQIVTLLILAQCWNLLAGYAGLVSVGQQAFVGVGAYAMFAAISLLGLDPLLGIAIGGIAAAVVAIPAGFFVFRLQGAYFAIGTWVVAEVLRLGVAQWKALGGGTGTSLPTGATRGLPGVDLVAQLMHVRGPQAVDIVTYWLALILLVATIGGIYGLLRSRQGLGLAAIRDNLNAARSVGVDPRWLRALVYGGAALVTGLAGGLIYAEKARISPDAAFSVTDWTAYVIFIVVIGGIGTIEGPIVGVVVFFLLEKVLASYGSWYLLVLGLLGIGVMLFARRGLWGLLTDRTGLQIFPIRRLLKAAPATRPDERGRRWPTSPRTY